MRKILLVNPSNSVAILTSVKWFKFVPLNLEYLRQIAEEEGFNVSVIDENREKIEPYLKEHYDLVGFNTITSTVNRAYELSKYFMERDIKTILGGVHVSMLPNEALKRASSILINEAEEIWPKVLEDLKKDNLKRLYKGNLVDCKKVPVLKNYSKNYHLGSIQTARGCPMNCDFCAVTNINGFKYRQRRIKDVLNEIEFMKNKFFVFHDDNLLGHGKKCEERAIKLFKGMIDRGIKKRWGAQISLNITENSRVLKWAREAGCDGFFAGIESLNKTTLKQFNKNTNLKIQIKNYKKAVKKVHDHSVALIGGFIFGDEHDRNDVFTKTKRFVFDTELDGSQYSILTPLPGTALFHRMKKSGRLLYTNFPNDWKYYDTFQCVIKPKNFTPEQLENNVKQLYEDTNSFLPSLSRSFKSFINTKRAVPPAFSFMLNYGYYKGFSSVLQHRNNFRARFGKSLCNKL